MSLGILSNSFRTHEEVGVLLKMIENLGKVAHLKPSCPKPQSKVIKNGQLQAAEKAL